MRYEEPARRRRVSEPGRNRSVFIYGPGVPNSLLDGGDMTFDIRRVDLGKLNSMTKYPSIPTYHTLGDKGMLQEAVQVPFAGRVLGTEKVDGTNTRLIFCPDGAVVVGSR